jgi:hypothetical protein
MMHTPLCSFVSTQWAYPVLVDPAPNEFEYSISHSKREIRREELTWYLYSTRCQKASRYLIPVLALTHIQYLPVEGTIIHKPKYVLICSIMKRGLSCVYLYLFYGHSERKTVVAESCLEELWELLCSINTLRQFLVAHG